MGRIVFAVSEFLGVWEKLAMKTFVNRKAHRAAKVRNTVHSVAQVLEKRLLFATFLPGDVAVFQVGAGSVALGTNATAVSIDEYSNTPASNPLVATNPIQSFPITGNFSAIGSDTSEGLLSLSSNGQYLLIPGYNLAPSSTVLTTDPNAYGDIARMDSSGNVDISTFPDESIRAISP